MSGVSRKLSGKSKEFIVSALAFVASYAWRDAIQGLFKTGGPLAFAGKQGPWAYAIIITIIAIVATSYLSDDESNGTQ